MPYVTVPPQLNKWGSCSPYSEEEDRCWRHRDSLSTI